MRGLAGLSLVGGDIVEVAPPFDGPGQITALLAANLMFEFLCVLALGSKSGAVKKFPQRIVYSPPSGQMRRKGASRIGTAQGQAPPRSRALSTQHAALGTRERVLASRT